MRIAMVGHVEHITLGRVPAVPRAGDIAHLQAPRSFPGGGGGIAFFQLTRSNAEILLYTALAARVLVITARRRPALLRSGVRADVVVGSAVDPRQACTLDDFPAQQRPSAIVLTEGAAGGAVLTEAGTRRFPAPARRPEGGGAYGAGDSFAGALTFFLAAGVPVLEACTRAGPYGAAVLGALEPLEAQLRLDV